MCWPRVRELIRKEFIQLFRDKRNRPVLIVMPILQLIIFGYVVTTDVRDVRVAVLDQSRTSESRMLMDALDANQTFRITHAVTRQGDLDALLMAREVDIAVSIPPDFAAKIREGRTAAIQVLADGSMSNMASVRVAHTMTVVEQLNRRLLEELHGRRMEYGKVDDRIRTWYNPNLDSQYFFVPGIVAFLVMLISLLLTSMAIIREKESGTMEQLMVTPMKPGELILGKTVPFLVISIVQMSIVTVLAIAWFRIPMSGSVVLLFFSALLFLASTLGIGLFISTISSTQQQAMMTTFFFILPFLLLSGFIFPISNMPPAVQVLTYANPLRYFLVIVRGIFLKGVGITYLWHQLGALALLGFVVFMAAAMRFHKRLD